MCLIHCYSEHVHIWLNGNLQKEHKICDYRNQFIVISALPNHHIVLRMEHFAHDWYAKSHGHFLYFIMQLAVQIHSFSSRSKWIGTLAVKENKGSVLCKQKATLITSYRKTCFYTRGERNMFYSVYMLIGHQRPWRGLCWVRDEGWEEPSGTLLQTLKDENIDNQDRTHAQQNTSWYTLSTAVRLPGVLRLPCKVKHLSGDVRFCGL